MFNLRLYGKVIVELSNKQCLPGEEEIWGRSPPLKRGEKKQRPGGKKKLGCVRDKSSLSCEVQRKGN